MLCSADSKKVFFVAKRYLLQVLLSDNMTMYSSQPSDLAKLHHEARRERENQQRAE